MAYGFASIDDDEQAQGAQHSESGGFAPMQGTDAPPSNGAGQSYADFLDGGSGDKSTQSGYLNYGSFASANGDVAKREAKSLNESTASKAQAAQQGVRGLNDKFLGQVAGGTSDGRPPPGSGGAAGPVVPATAPATPIDSNTVVNGNGVGVDRQGLGGDSTKPPSTQPAAAPLVPFEPGVGGADQTEAARRAELEGRPMTANEQTQSAQQTADVAARAADPSGSYRDFLEGKSTTEYGGPMSIQDDAGYGKVAGDVRSADEQLNALGTPEGLSALARQRGGNQYDAALLGSAGGEAFQQTRDAYGEKGTGSKSMSDALGTVSENAGGVAQNAKNAADATANEYRNRLANYDKQAADEKSAKDAKPGGETLAEKEAKKQKFLDYQKMDAHDYIRNGLDNMSPLNNLWGMVSGGNSPGALMANKLGGDRKSHAFGEDDQDVFESMSAEDWANFNNMTEQGQEQWVAQRRTKVRGGK